MSLSEKLRRKGGGEVGNPGESVVSKKGQSSDGERHQIKQGCSGGGVSLGNHFSLRGKEQKPD